jgi:cytochrome c biogenesis protein CcdA
MEIKKTFASSFGYIWMAKMRRFFKVHIFLYGLGSLLITCGLDVSFWPAAQEFSFLQRWLAMFATVIILVLGMLAFATFVQSKIQLIHTAIFSDETIFLCDNRNSELVDRGWAIIKMVDETPSYYALLVREYPRFEWFIYKNQLDSSEKKQFRTWFERYEKL